MTGHVAAVLIFSALAGGLALNVGVVASSRELALEQAWLQELDGQAKNVSPVKRVVSLLQKMKTELEAEAKAEAESYDKMACWCQTNEKEKDKAVADADAKDLELTSEVESRGARFGELSAEIAQLKAQIARDESSLREAIAIREKAASEFSNEEKELMQVVTNLQNAIKVLSKHQPGSLLQLDAPLVAGLRVLLHDAATKYEVLVAYNRAHRHGRKPQAALLAVGSGAVSREGAESAGQRLLAALKVDGQRVPDGLPLRYAETLVARNAGAASFLQAASKQPLYASYSTRSTEIYGILTQMLDEFKAELSTAQTEELKAIEEHKGLAAAKSGEIDAGKRKLDDLEGEHAGNQLALSQAKQDLAATREQRSADVEFLQNLKLKCNDVDTQWEQRRKTRDAEVQAVAEAIAILTEDDNRELLAKSVSLLQVHRSVEVSGGLMAARRALAAESLRRAARAPTFNAEDLLSAWRGRSAAKAVAVAAGPRARLATLAVSVQLDAFTKVKEAIEKMVAELQAQQAEEVQFKAYCEQSFQDNEKATYAKSQEKADLEGKIDQLNSLLQTLAKEIEDAKAQIAQSQVEIKKAGEVREAENRDFQATVSDQRATQEVLKKALVRLQEFYEKGIGKQVFVQRQDPTPPEQFRAYKTNAGASPVMNLLQQIVEDSQKLEKEAIAAENSAQAAYETFVKDTNAVIGALTEAINTKAKAEATANLEKSEAERGHQSAAEELGSLAAYEADLHTQCDFVLKNFAIRQQARLQEIEAIQSAKAILSGAQTE